MKKKSVIYNKKEKKNIYCMYLCVYIYHHNVHIYTEYISGNKIRNTSTMALTIISIPPMIYEAYQRPRTEIMIMEMIIMKMISDTKQTQQKHNSSSTDFTLTRCFGDHVVINLEKGVFKGVNKSLHYLASRVSLRGAF